MADSSPPLERKSNIALNTEEFAGRLERLRSTPKRVTLGTHNSCNARCTFCLEGQYERFSLELYKDFFERKAGHLIRGAEEVTFTGFGEILWIPGVEEFLDHLNKEIPDTWKIFTTNGTPLRPSVTDRILDGKYILQISLHASNAELHERLTRLSGEFDGILARIETLVDARQRRRLQNRLHFQLVDCVTTGNIDDLSEFLKLGFRLGVQEIRAFYMTMFLPEHIPQSCFFEQARANRGVERAGEIAQLLATGRDAAGLPLQEFVVRLPPRFGEPACADAPQPCSEPWNHVYVELQGSVAPCCQWGEHIGDLKRGDDIDVLWNGELYRELRRGMAAREPHPWCASCVRYRGYNVNDLLCHLTNRPHTQAKLLEEIGRRGLAAAPALAPERA